MESGLRKRVSAGSFEGTAVDVDWSSPDGGPFSGVDICVNLSVAATTSENLTIVSSVGTLDILEAFENLSTLSVPEATSKVFRFDKRFPAGTTIKIDFANTDAADIEIIIDYQTDGGGVA